MVSVSGPETFGVSIPTPVKEATPAGNGSLTDTLLAVFGLLAPFVTTIVYVVRSHLRQPRARHQ